MKRGILYAVMMAVLLVGCTVTPKIVRPSVASFEGNVQNSGVVCLLPDGGAIVVPHWRERYNAMVPVFGKGFYPPLVLDRGITDSTNGEYRVTAEALANFGKMNLRRKNHL
jgi:hypothetical protein